MYKTVLQGWQITGHLFKTISCLHFPVEKSIVFYIAKSLFPGTIALEEDAQILKVIEAYCTGAGFQQNLSSGNLNVYNFVMTELTAGK